MKSKILFAAFCTISQLTNSVAQQNESAILKRADALITEAHNKGIFSGVVVISHNGKKIYLNTTGYGDWQSKGPLNEATLFNIGSLNKKFTQEIITQLAAEKKLTYSDKLSQYLDLYPGETGNKITIQQLVDMKAGLGDFLQDPNYLNDLRHKDFSLQDLVNIIKQEPLLFEPGTSVAYSNSGYAVLGAVIEKITGTTYEENLRERIAKPLQLKNIYYTKTEIEQQKNRASATLIDLDGNKTSAGDVANSTSAGGAYMNIDDLLKFTEAKLLHSPVTGDRPGVPLFAGGSPGWSSALSYNERNGFVVVVLANTGDDIAVKITKRLNSIIDDQPFPPLDQPLKMSFYKMIKEKGYDYIKQHAKDLAEQQRLPYDDHFLNDIAGEFLIANKPDIAINLYKVNLDLFPQSVYTFDVLAQTLLKSGDKAKALVYLKKLLILAPDNQKAKDLVSDLESGK